MNDTEKETRLKRLKYRANHRGIKEMDIILGGFANDALKSLDDQSIDAFEELMKEHDRDLLVWFTGEAEFPIPGLVQIFQQVSRHMTSRHNEN